MNPDSIWVIIASGDADTIDALKKFLYFEKDIEVVAVASSGDEALSLTQQFRPGVMIVDTNIQGMDCFALIEAVVAQVVGTQVIVISASAEADLLRRAMLAGAREFLIKPFSSEQLANTLRGAATIPSRVHSPRQVDKRPPPAPASPPSDRSATPSAPVPRPPGGLLKRIERSYSPTPTESTPTEARTEATRLRRQAAPAASQVLEVKRFGRVEYVTPMDLEREYSLRVGFLLERHGRNLLPQTRVHWATLRIDAAEEEPTIRVTPYSSYFYISPPLRDIRVKKTEDVFAGFRIAPRQMPDTPGGFCDVTIDIDYRGELVKSISLAVQVQKQFAIGPVRIPHAYWQRAGLVGGGLGTIEVALNAYQGIIQISQPLLVAGLVISTVLLVLSVVLWRHAARPQSQTF